MPAPPCLPSMPPRRERRDERAYIDPGTRGRRGCAVPPHRLAAAAGAVPLLCVQLPRPHQRRLCAVADEGTAGLQRCRVRPGRKPLLRRLRGVRGTEQPAAGAHRRARDAAAHPVPVGPGLGGDDVRAHADAVLRTALPHRRVRGRLRAGRALLPDAVVPAPPAGASHRAVLHGVQRGADPGRSHGRRDHDLPRWRRRPARLAMALSAGGHPLRAAGHRGLPHAAGPARRGRLAARGRQGKAAGTAARGLARAACRSPQRPRRRHARCARLGTGLRLLPADPRHLRARLLATDHAQGHGADSDAGRPLRHRARHYRRDRLAPRRPA